jgi:hypothetical protein
MTNHIGGLARRDLVIASLFVFAACSGSGVTEVQKQDQRDPLVQSLIARGFRADMIEDKGTYFLVEGDLAFDKTNLSAEIDSATGPVPYFQAVTTNLVGFPNTLNIRVNLSALNNYPAWATAVRAAMNEWSTLAGAGVRFTENGPYPYRITYYTYSEPCPDPQLGQPCTLAYASFPSGGLPGSSVHINLGFNYGYGSGGEPTALSKLYNMVHELGHTIAFRHTNWQQLGEGTGTNGANTVVGTPTSDASSIMNGGTANSDWAGFSYYDRLATRKIYLGYGPTASGSIASGHPQLTWSALPEAQSYNVRLTTPVYDSEWGGWVDGSSVTVGTTSSTSLIDSSRSATYVGSCTESTPFYYVTANFPGGITTYGSGFKICFF